MLLLSLAEAINNLFLAFFPPLIALILFVFGIYKYESYKQKRK